jgi:hypothetical protein
MCQNTFSPLLLRWRLSLLASYIIYLIANSMPFFDFDYTFLKLSLKCLLSQEKMMPQNSRLCANAARRFFHKIHFWIKLSAQLPVSSAPYGLPSDNLFSS